MNSINEKEKKLNIALEELKNLDLRNPELQKNIENLSTKQNQLEIERDINQEFIKKRQQSKSHLVSSEQVDKEERPSQFHQRAFNPKQENFVSPQ